MRAYARKFGEDEEHWGIVGLLHDFDWEVHPTLEEHPAKGAEILRERGVDESIIGDIQAHAPHTGTVRDTLVRKAIFAVDELAGMIVAVGLVRPTGLDGMKAKSVRKKMKDKSFAAAINREDIRLHQSESDEAEAVYENAKAPPKGTHVDELGEAVFSKLEEMVGGKDAEA